ncbi:hypothetical protein [Streptomyces sp. NPDC057854]|uniref:hypothetical protein n=1 Tax=unclassified Streptomyces TaxID=2593676 RepID=UPI0036B11439
MRPAKLPGDSELLRLEAAGLTHAEIAARYDVSRQAVTKRFNQMDRYPRQQFRDVTAVLPWDISTYPAKHEITHNESMIGLRAFLLQQAGSELSGRHTLALRVFTSHVKAGEVLELDPVQGLRWVQRDEVRDGSLVIRWPEGVPQDERTAMFRLPAAQSPPAGEATEG